MPPAIFQGKPSKGFLCCYITLTQTVEIAILIALSFSIYRVSNIKQEQDIKYDEYIGRLVYLSLGLTIDLLMELAIFGHICGLIAATKSAERLAELKKKQVVLTENKIIEIPSAYEVIQ